MNKHVLTWTTLTLTLAGLVYVTSAAATRDAGAAPKAADAKAARIARGEYIVKTSACTDCHTPVKMGPNGPEPDLAHFLAGHPASLVMPPAPTLPPGPWIATVGATMTAWSGPWGTSFTANLTPDKETGIGAWTEKEFVDTIRTGRHLGRGREILPPMPWPVYRNLTDEDLGSVYDYLQSIPAISNRVPAPLPPAAAR